MEQILKRLENAMLVPVIALEDADKAEGLADALCRAGIPVAEVTFRTAAAAQVIRRMTRARPDMLVGAGTVLTREQADAAMEAGAAFLVSPGLNPQVLAYAQEKGYPMMPGVCTPSEIEQGLSFGLTTLKFFPAEAAGGLEMIKAVSAPYSMVRFMPTGGISEKNIGAYLKNPRVLCCGGSWIVPKDALKAGDFEKVEALSREAVKNMLALSVKRVSGMTRAEAERALEQAPFDVLSSRLPEPGAGEREIVLTTPVLFRVAARMEAMGYPAREKSPQRFVFQQSWGEAKFVMEQE